MEIAAEKGSHRIRNTDKIHGTESKRQGAQPPKRLSASIPLGFMNFK